MGRSLVAVFIPIILLQIGYSIEDVILFFVILYLVNVPLNFLSRSLIQKVGARWVIVMGKIWSIGFFVLLAFLTPNNWPLLILLAFLSAMYDAFYWVGHRFLFIKSTGESRDVGTKTGVLYAVQRFAGFLGPAIGAGILIFFDKQALMFTSIVILTLSVFPLLKIKHFPDKPTRKPLPFKAFFSEWREKKNFLSTSLFAIHRVAENILWPLFIFVVFETIESVAIVPVIVSITAIVFSYFTGYVRQKSRDKMIVVGATLIALVWVLRIFVEAKPFLFFSVFLVSIFSILVMIPLSSNIFSRGKERDPLGTSTFMNATHMFAILILFSVLALFVNVFNVSFIAAVVSLVSIIAIHYLFTLMGRKEES